MTIASDATEMIDCFSSKVDIHTTGLDLLALYTYTLNKLDFALAYLIAVQKIYLL